MLWRKFSLVSALLALVIMVNGCTTLSNLHTARPVSKGKTEFSFATGAFGAMNEGDHGVIPTLVEFAVRHGLTDNMDLGVHGYIPGLLVDLNIMVVDTGSFAMSIDPAFSAMYFSMNDDSTFFGTGWLGILMDVVSTESFTLTLGPRGGFQFVTADIDSEEDGDGYSGTETGGLVGGVIAFRFQLTKGFALAPEFSVYALISEHDEAMVYNASLVFVF